MNTKEKIIFSALELAAEHGLGSVSLSQIADKAGIRKASLYNHFASKDEIIAGMYSFLRDRAKERQSLTDIDYGELVRDRTLGEVLTLAADNYRKLCTEPDMLTFYRVIYSQRAVDPAAAGIIAEETGRMLNSTKNLFYALRVHDKLFTDDTDTAAVSFAMTVHAVMDYTLDCINAGRPVPDNMLENYIKWFSQQFGGNRQ